MCDAFTRMDLEDVLRAVAPSVKVADGGDLDKAIARVEDGDSISTMIDVLNLARESLDQDEPDGETVLAAMDCVVRAIELAEEVRDSMISATEDARSAYNEVAEAERCALDPDDLIAELEYRGYQIVKVPRTIARQAIVQPVKRRVPRLRKAA